MQVSINETEKDAKTVEKALVYVATLVTTTNVFGTIGVPTGVKEWALGAAGFILAAIHVSTPSK